MNDDNDGPDARPPGALLDLLAKLHLTLGGVQAAIEENDKARRRLQNNPVLAPVSGTSVGVTNNVVPASGILLLDLGGPQTGREWRVRFVNFSDAGNWATTMGSAVAQFYVGKNTTPTAVAPQQCRWPFAVCPNAATFGSDELPVRPSDRLYCLFTGANAGQVLQASAMIQDFDPSLLARASETA
jgi:hypothetical protein